MKITEVIICPGCGWTGNKEGLKDGCCPICEYHNGSPPCRLLTLSEMLVEDGLEYVDVRMDLFLSAIFRHLFPDKKWGKEHPKPVRSNVYDLSNREEWHYQAM